jgi:hypothetical protein
MKIFGINFETKKELRYRVSVLELDLDACEEELEACEDELAYMQQKFPLDLCQVVYDVALKNAQGRYTKTKPSREHCTITEVEVNEKNYFGLVKRLKNCDVFLSQEDAESYLDHVCK